MWYRRFLAIIWICLMIFISVKGSCLEYGHSCWGAHGKRSGGKPVRDGELKELMEMSGNAALPGKPFESLEELNNFAVNPSQSRQPNSVEEVLGDPNSGTHKLKELLRHHQQLRLLKYRSRNMRDNDEDDALRQSQQRLQAEPWPLFKLPSLSTTVNVVKSSPLSQGDRNELLQQLERQSAAAAAAAALDDGAYYDIQ